MGLAVTGCFLGQRAMNNGGVVVFTPGMNSGNFTHYLPEITSGIRLQTTQQIIAGVAVAYSGRFDDPRAYSGDTAL